MPFKRLNEHRTEHIDDETAKKIKEIIKEEWQETLDDLLDTLNISETEKLNRDTEYIVESELQFESKTVDDYKWFIRKLIAKLIK